MDILMLDNGKRVSITPGGLDREEALEIARRLFDAWGLRGRRVSRKLMYEVEPAIYSDCNHYMVGEEEQVLRQVAEEERLVEKRGKEDLPKYQRRGRSS